MPTPVVDAFGLHHPLLPAGALPLLALRDRCECATCSHPSGQRLLDPAALSTDLTATVVSGDEQQVTVRWEPEGHLSTYSLAALTAPQEVPAQVHLWAADAAAQLPVAAHAMVASADRAGREALLHWLRGVAAMGCGVLTGVPIADGEVARVAELFGFVRHTNYGRWFDVRTQVDPTNLANTSLGLPPHTDNPYRDPVPTLQLLHCHQSSTAGGSNVLVDGWRIAAELRAADPDGFAQLARRAVTFAYHDETVALSATAPLIELAPDGQVRALRSNHRSLQQLPLPTSDKEVRDLEVWYRAYTRFARMVADPSFHLHVQLRPGDLFIVDNRRVLHGRTAYDAGGGSRHLQGCYADIDGLHSTISVLERSLVSADGSP